MLRSSWAELPEQIRARSGHWDISQSQQLQRQWVRRHPHRDAGQAGGDEIGNQLGFRQHERQRSRPKSRGELLSGFGPSRHQSREPRTIGDVNDQRIEVRPILHREHASDRVDVQSVGSQAVHRLGREAHELPLTQQASGMDDIYSDGATHRLNLLIRCVRGLGKMSS